MSRRNRSVSLSKPKSDSFAPREGSSLQETAEPGNPLKRFGGLTSIFEDLVANRPEKEELVSRNILKGENVAGAIQAAQEHLKIKFLEDNLKGKLAARPTPEKLVEQNIMKDQSVAPALQGAQAELEQQLLKDSLRSSLSKRPSEKDLSKILQPTNA